MAQLSPELNDSLDVLKEQVRNAAEFLGKHPCGKLAMVEVTGGVYDSDSADTWDVTTWLQVNRDNQGGYRFEILYLNKETCEPINYRRLEDFPLSVRLEVYPCIPDLIEDAISKESQVAQEMSETAHKIEQALAFHRDKA